MQQWGKLTMDAKADLAKIIAKPQADLFNPKSDSKELATSFSRQQPTTPASINLGEVKPSFVLGSMGLQRFSREELYRAPTPC
ncbi:hypothetical protein B0J13DRAFT_564182 [Dactylonectria estremocensis]|uniref:Uncharacterized protein n=1 Tax=Dactylonectria estremocensis TaxID=1079267 RepID=A0A9P9E3X2_9HYPO|nr:hypothetical protein B0J13DRAFT_564182 [Dactylonectria estremocensis]